MLNNTIIPYKNGLHVPKLKMYTEFQDQTPNH